VRVRGRALDFAAGRAGAFLGRDFLRTARFAAVPFAFARFAFEPTPFRLTRDEVFMRCSLTRVCGAVTAGPRIVAGAASRPRHSGGRASSGYPASRHALRPPSSATARVKPISRSVAAASVEIFPNSQQVRIDVVGSGSIWSTRISS
jgi:hypothetical protein